MRCAASIRRDPILAAAHRRTRILSAARSGWRPKRVAWSADLGITKVDREVAAITRKAAERFAELGAIVEEAHPDLTGPARVLHHAARL